MKKDKTGQADEATVQKMKKENPAGVFFVESNGHVAYFREPTRHDVNAALAVSDPARPLAIAEKFGELLFIGGSREVLSNDLMFIGAATQLRVKMNGYRASLGNL